MNGSARIVILDDQWRLSKRSEVFNELLEKFGIITPIYTFSSSSLAQGGLISSIDNIAEMRPDLIICDLDILDVGLPRKGIALIGRMKRDQRLADVPVLVVSEYIFDPSIGNELEQQGIRKDRQFSWPHLRDNKDEMQNQFEWSVKRALDGK